MTIQDPFEGMRRLRPPAMHMISALEMGIPAIDALAGHMFAMMHDTIKHTCLTEEVRRQHEAKRRKALENAKSPDGFGMANVFSIIGSTSLHSLEWSYISDDEAFQFHLMASTMIEQVQRWINAGIEKPHRTTFGQNLVYRGSPQSFTLSDEDRAANKAWMTRIYKECIENRTAKEGKTYPWWDETLKTLGLTPSLS